MLNWHGWIGVAWYCKMSDLTKSGVAVANGQSAGGGGQAVRASS